MRADSPPPTPMPHPAPTPALAWRLLTLALHHARAGHSALLKLAVCLDELPATDPLQPAVLVELPIEDLASIGLCLDGLKDTIRELLPAAS